MKNYFLSRSWTNSISALNLFQMVESKFISHFVSGENIMLTFTFGLIVLKELKFNKSLNHSCKSQYFQKKLECCGMTELTNWPYSTFTFTHNKLLCTLNIHFDAFISQKKIQRDVLNKKERGLCNKTLERNSHPSLSLLLMS